LVVGCVVNDDSDALSALVASSHQPTGSVRFSGDIPGTWRPTTEWGASVCGQGEIRIWIAGPAPDDRGTLRVKSDGSIWVDIEKYGDYYASGGTFRPGRGFTVNSDVATLRGKHAHVEGTLNC
jgi:hypothetical protein